MGVNGRYLRLEGFCSSRQLLIVNYSLLIELSSVNSRALVLTPVNSCLLPILFDCPIDFDRIVEHFDDEGEFRVIENPHLCTFFVILEVEEGEATELLVTIEQGEVGLVEDDLLGVGGFFAQGIDDIGRSHAECLAAGQREMLAVIGLHIA